MAGVLSAILLASIHHPAPTYHLAPTYHPAPTIQLSPTIQLVRVQHLAWMRKSQKWDSLDFLDEFEIVILDCQVSQPHHRTCQSFPRATLPTASLL